MSLVANERWKLTATALNGVAVATMVTGFVAPLVAVSYGVPSMSGSIYLIGIAAIWFLTGIGIHIGARFVLGRLRE
jgi:hypothetical protein